jgi:hypothetical protein
LSARFGDVSNFIAYNRRIVRRDQDNAMLFTGKVGSGKSTVATQILKALDQRFTVDNIHYTIPGYIRSAGTTPRYGARLLDEVLISSRKSMFGEVQDLNDHLQINRGLNHHQGLCFPNRERVDKAISERVRWNIHCPSLGVAQLCVLKDNPWKQDQPWRVIDGWTFKPNEGTFRDAYEAKKTAHMKRIEESLESFDDKSIDALGGDGEVFKATARQVFGSLIAEAR